VERSNQCSATVVEQRRIFADYSQKHSLLDGRGRNTPPVPGASQFFVGNGESTPDARMAQKYSLSCGDIGFGIAGIQPRGGTLIGLRLIIRIGPLRSSNLAHPILLFCLISGGPLIGSPDLNFTDFVWASLPQRLP
jgi:hypothetical protein